MASGNQARRTDHVLPVLILLVTLCSRLLATPVESAAAAGDAAPRETNVHADERGSITQLSIEELMDIEITTTAKKPVKLSHATSAIFVITAEDIRRSGATAVPDLLRMVPGVEVARISANQWAVTARGFNGRFANKLLVLVDGRSIYTPSFSGVYWEVQDLLPEDIDRIEVIRGPGATLWGSNAVNGVINIITKHAKETRGGLAALAAGSEERATAAVRYGGSAGDALAYRIYAKYVSRDGSVSPEGIDYEDTGELARGGFRIDVSGSSHDTFTVLGDAYAGLAGQMLKFGSFMPPYHAISENDARVSGRDLLARWNRSVSSTSKVQLQAYYDGYTRREAAYRETRDTADVEFEHRFALTGRHDILWGVGYRTTKDDVQGTYFMSLLPDRRRDDLASAFLQDEMTLTDNVDITLGTKVEHNDYSGTEIQPNARMLWIPVRGQSVWAAASRATRTPSRLDADSVGNTYVFPTTPPTQVRINGSRLFRSEELTAYETGYRVQATEKIFLDAVTFYNIYEDLRTGEPGLPFLETTPAPLHQVQPFTAANRMGARVFGFEAAADWKVLPWWTIDIAYTFLEMELHRNSGSLDPVSENAEGESPHHQVSLRSAMDLHSGLEFDLWLRFVDELPSFPVERYLELDLRIGWKPRRDLEVVLMGQNLLDDRHAEFQREIYFVPSSVERSVYGKAIWSF